jgi:hypothetical protein
MGGCPHLDVADACKAGSSARPTHSLYLVRGQGGDLAGSLLLCLG